MDLLKGGRQISGLPELKIKTFGYAGEDTCSLDQAACILDFERRFVIVEGQKVNSYTDLVALASSEKFRDREYIEVVLLPKIAGG